MKTIAYEYVDWDNKTNSNVWKTRLRNGDDQEILKWMRELTKIEAFGLKELPLWKGSMVARFISTKTLHNDCVVCYVIVKDYGIKRNFISINSKRFTNNGRCTVLGAMTKEKLMTSILSHMDGKRVGLDGIVAINEFEKRFLEYKKSGGFKPNPIKVVLGMATNQVFDKNDYTLGDVKEFCQKVIDEDPDRFRDFLYPEEDNGVRPNWMKRYELKYKTF